MHRCLQLAKQAAGFVAPNPMVGAVLVYNDVVIGEGYHQQFGQAHAEVNCINSVMEHQKNLIEKSTLYVSLEPCAHFGKTPPCVNLIIEKKIPTVIIGCRDNYEAVNGKGIAALQAAGIEVIVGILEQEAVALNKRFFTFHKYRRPYIILKWAQTNNGKIGNADFSRLHISNENTNRLVHQWRSREAAIMVGTTTALQDDPSLTTRLFTGKNPLRIVIDKTLKLPASLQLLADAEPTLIFNEIKNETIGNKYFYCIDFKKPALPQILKQLYELNIQSVLVEGGAKLLQSFIDEKLWDEARVITNATLAITDGIAAPVLKKESLAKSITNQSDQINYYNPLQQ